MYNLLQKKKRNIFRKEMAEFLNDMARNNAKILKKMYLIKNQIWSRNFAGKRLKLNFKLTIKNSKQQNLFKI